MFSLQFSILLFLSSVSFYFQAFSFFSHFLSFYSFVLKQLHHQFTYMSWFPVFFNPWWCPQEILSILSILAHHYYTGGAPWYCVYTSSLLPSILAAVKAVLVDIVFALSRCFALQLVRCVLHTALILCNSASKF